MAILDRLLQVQRILFLLPQNIQHNNDLLLSVEKNGKYGMLRILLPPFSPRRERAFINPPIPGGSSAFFQNEHM